MSRNLTTHPCKLIWASSSTLLVAANSMRMTKIWNTENITCWWVCGVIGSLIHWDTDHSSGGLIPGCCFISPGMSMTVPLLLHGVHASFKVAHSEHPQLILVKLTGMNAGINCRVCLPDLFFFQLTYYSFNHSVACLYFIAQISVIMSTVFL